MPDKGTHLESKNIVREIAASYQDGSEANSDELTSGSSEVNSDNNSEAKEQRCKNDSFTISSNDCSTKPSKPRKKKSALTADDLKYKKGYQNLEERTKLLGILKSLFKLQLFFMNAIVLIVVLWVALDFSFLRSIDADVLKSIIELLKYYIAAILVELLGGVIFIVHQVFTDKTIDVMDK